MIEEIQSRLATAFADARPTVIGEGNHFAIDIVSTAFEGMGRVKRQQAVYAVIADLIAAGTVHAVTIKARTPGEAE